MKHLCAEVWSSRHLRKTLLQALRHMGPTMGRIVPQIISFLPIKLDHLCL